MKISAILFLLGLNVIHPSAGVAMDHQDAEDERVLSADIIEEVACAVTTKSRVLCWTAPNSSGLYWTNPALLNPPADLKNPKEVVISNSEACVTTDRGIRCWGDDAEGLQAETARWRHPRGLQLFIEENWGQGPKYLHGLCAITDQGVKCTNGRERDLPEEALDADKIQMMFSRPCVLKEGEVDCGEANSHWEDASTVPNGLRNFRDVSFTGGGLNACGISTDRGLVCWGNPDFLEFLKQPKKEFKSARKVVATSDEVCVITSSAGIQCWGNGIRNVNLVPDSFDIQDLFLSGNNKCVINKAGKMRCIGDSLGGYFLSLTVPKEIGY